MTSINDLQERDNNANHLKQVTDVRAETRRVTKL